MKVTEGSIRGRAHLSPTYLVSYYPKAVLTECSIFCKVLNLRVIGSLGMLARLMIKEAILCTTRL